MTTIPMARVRAVAGDNISGMADSGGVWYGIGVGRVTGAFGILLFEVTILSNVRA